MDQPTAPAPRVGVNPKGTNVTESPATPTERRRSPVVGYVRSVQLGDPRLGEWEEQLRRYAAENGLNLVEVVRDEGVSGVAVWKPGLESVIARMEKGAVSGLIILDRLHIAGSRAEEKRLADRVAAASCWILPIA